VTGRFCLRCDWAGEAERPECPRCGAPLYWLSSPEPTPPRVIHRSARRPSSGISDIRPATVEAAPDEEVPPAIASTVRGRWSVIALALLLAGTSFAFAVIRGARPDPVAAVGGEEIRSDPESPPGLASPSPATTQQGQPGTCSPDGSPVVFLTQLEAVRVPAATADYRFQDSLGSKVGAARDLVEIGEGTIAFTDEGMIGRSVLSFARGSGLSFTPTGVIEGTEYTIEVLFRFDRVDGYRKIIDFRDGSDDEGLYVLDGCLNFYPRRPRPSIPIEADSYVQVVLTRNSSARVVGYVDGIRQFAFRDKDSLAEIASQTLRFFVDDSVTEGDSSGAVSQIRLYDRPLTASQVAALACAEIRVPLATHPCRDPR
jgi:hypothetical protein